MAKKARKTPASAAVAGVSAGPVAPAKINTTFSLYEPYAQQVSLCGEFNEWLPEETALTRQESGLWAITLALAPGRYQYKFVVDGQWLADPNAQENVPNAFGSLNSVIEVRG
jgi:1,4-alpha-glucan branching enzyme